MDFSSINNMLLAISRLSFGKKGSSWITHSVRHCQTVSIFVGWRHSGVHGKGSHFKGNNNNKARMSVDINEKKKEEEKSKKNKKDKKEKGGDLPKWSVVDMDAHINGADFEAICEFESNHPELYKDAVKHEETEESYERDLATQMCIQMESFNWIFNHPDYSQEFKKLISDIRNA